MSPELLSACEEFAGGIIAKGTECVVLLKKSGEEVLKVDVVSGIPTGDPRDLVKSIAELSGVPVVDIEIFVYAMCGGARGRDIYNGGT